MRRVVPRLAPPSKLNGHSVQVAGDELVILSFDAPPLVPVPGLTPAEHEVCALLLEGLSNREIAARRGSAPRTVANQLARIFVKLEVGSRAALIALLSRGRRGAP
jgi:DNA-binding CsgD family transcriptional regulator